MAKGCSTGRLYRETCRDRSRPGISDLSGTVCTGKPVAPGYEGYPGNPGTPGNSEDSETEGKIWPHHFRVSPDCVPYMEEVLSIVRQTYGRSPTDDLNDFDVNTAVWSIFMSVTLQAAVHLGQEYTESLQSTKNQPLKSVRQSFQTTGLSASDWKQSMWKETSLLCDRAVHIANSKTCVFSDSVLCLGSLERQDQMVLGITLSQRFGSNRRGADGVRVAKFPGIPYIVNSR